MARYFTNFPIINYKFGNEDQTTLFNNLSIYSDLVDTISDDVLSYQYYNVLDGDRPDTLSYKIYGRSEYHWTFYLLNKHIRESGWPLTEQEVSIHLTKNFPDEIVTSNCRDIEGIKLNSDIADDNIGALFTVGQTVTGYNSSNVGTIVDRQIDIGQFIISSGQADAFLTDQYITYNDAEGQAQFLRVISSTQEKNGVHHYEDSNGVWQDIDPFEITTRTPSGLVTKTFEENFRSRNDELKEIKVFKKDIIKQVVSEYFKSIR
jgi:hypothetical protein|tara:strand:- start:4152 stop:4937 length:786 start_codon:yes stop_codon:yes gene_type:complete